MKRILFALLIIMAFNATAQNARSKRLTYSDISNLTKIEHWSDINDTLIVKGFKYALSDNDSKESQAYWTKYCTITRNTVNNQKINVKVAADYGNLYEYIKFVEKKNENHKIVFYYFSSKYIYKSLLDSVKQNGFEFVKDGTVSNSIFTTYNKNHEDNLTNNNYLEVYHFYIRENENYCVEYHRIGTDKKKSMDSSNEKTTNKIEPKTNNNNNANNTDIKDLRAFRYQHVTALDKNLKEVDDLATSGTILISKTNEGEWVIVGMGDVELSGKVVKRNPTEKPDKNHEIYSCLFGSDYEGQRIVLVLDEYYDVSKTTLVPEKIILSMLNPKTAETTAAFLFTQITRAR